MYSPKQEDRTGIKKTLWFLFLDTDLRFILSTVFYWLFFPASFVYLSSMLVSVIWSPQDESHTQIFPVQLKMVSMHSEVSPMLPFKTVPMFIWSMTTLFHPFKEDCLALPLSMPLSCRQSMVWCRHFPVPVPKASDQITSKNAGPQSWIQHSQDNQSKQLITLTSISQYLHFSDFTHITSWEQLVSNWILTSCQLTIHILTVRNQIQCCLDAHYLHDITINIFHIINQMAPAGRNICTLSVFWGQLVSSHQSSFNLNNSIASYSTHTQIHTHTYTTHAE